MESRNSKEMVLEELRAKIKTSAPKTEQLRKFDERKEPTAIFQFGTKTIEQETLSKQNKTLRKVSSASSTDSGFAITPGTPPFQLYVDVDSPSRPQQIPRASSRETTEAAWVERGFAGSSSPPPLPMSSPPKLSHDAFADFSFHKNSNQNDISLTEEYSSELREDPFMPRDVSETDSSTCESSASDECDTYDVTNYSVKDERNGDVLPFRISKLGENVKTVRSKIKPGTVSDITKIFVNKAKRAKRQSKRSKHRKHRLRDRNDGSININGISNWNRNNKLDDSEERLKTSFEGTTNRTSTFDSGQTRTDQSETDSVSSEDTNEIAADDESNGGKKSIYKGEGIKMYSSSLTIKMGSPELCDRQESGTTSSDNAISTVVLQSVHQKTETDSQNEIQSNSPECYTSFDQNKPSKCLQSDANLKEAPANHETRSKPENVPTSSNLDRRRSFVLTLKQFYDEGQSVPKDLNYESSLMEFQPFRRKSILSRSDGNLNRHRGLQKFSKSSEDITSELFKSANNNSSPTRSVAMSPTLKSYGEIKFEPRADEQEKTRSELSISPRESYSFECSNKKEQKRSVDSEPTYEKHTDDVQLYATTSSENNNSVETDSYFGATSVISAEKKVSDISPENDLSLNGSGDLKTEQISTVRNVCCKTDTEMDIGLETEPIIDTGHNNVTSDITGNILKPTENVASGDITDNCNNVSNAVTCVKSVMNANSGDASSSLTENAKWENENTDDDTNFITRHSLRSVMNKPKRDHDLITNKPEPEITYETESDFEDDVKKSVTVIHIGGAKNTNVNKPRGKGAVLDYPGKTNRVNKRNSSLKSDGCKTVDLVETTEFSINKTVSGNTNCPNDNKNDSDDRIIVSEYEYNLLSSQSSCPSDKLEYTNYNYDSPEHKLTGNTTMKHNKLDDKIRIETHLDPREDEEQVSYNNRTKVSVRRPSEVDYIKEFTASIKLNPPSPRLSTTEDLTKEKTDSIHADPLTADVNERNKSLKDYSEFYIVNQDKCLSIHNTDNERKTPSFVKLHPTEADEKSSQAYLTPGSSDGKSSPHVISSLTGIVLTNTAHTPQVSDGCCGSEEADDKNSLPEFYTLPGTFKTDKIVTLKEIPARRRMPEKSSGYTSSSSEGSGYTGGRKVSTKTMTLHSSNKDGRVVDVEDGNLESNIHIKHLAETISQLNGDNNDELLPEINQTVTKLPGGNLVITTLTHKIVEEEEEKQNEEDSGSPDDTGGRYIVQDHRGNYYMVEDITDETQESAYYSSTDTHNTSQSSINGYDKQGQFQGINNLRSVGRSGITYDTAEEVLLGLYNPPGFMEIQEYDENTYEGKYSRERERYGAPGGQQYQVAPYGVKTDTSMDKRTTTYSYDDVDNKIQRPIPQNIGSSNVKTVKHSYEMESSAPWMTDGTTGRMVHRQDNESVSGVSEPDEGYTTSKREAMQTTETHADSAGLSSMNASYMLQSSATMVPPVLLPPVLPPPPQPVIPQYRVAKLDVTPAVTVAEQTSDTAARQISTQISESHTHEKVMDVSKDIERKEVTETERPIYKTVALVKGPYESPKWHKMKRDTDSSEEVVDNRKYKILNSRASDDVQEQTMEISSSKTMYQVQRSEYDENKNFSFASSMPQHRFKTEKVFQINGTSPSSAPAKTFQTRINVTGDAMDSSRTPISYNDASNYEYMEENKRTTTEMKMHNETQNTMERNMGKDMRVVRGNILIKNTLDDNLDEYSDNINLFDQAFNMTKDNPLYQSDEDLYKKYDQERSQGYQQNLQNDLTNDLTFETVDRYTKSKEVKRQQERQRTRPKQTLSQLLLSKLSSIDSKDIRQYIDVKHHNEDIYGDVNFIHADGSTSRSDRTSNFDSVGENVDLMLRDGKAFITIKVTAERITPVDLEFNVWRKNQAIVTRVIEIDFFANEQRRRLYENVMDRTSQRDSEYIRHGKRVPRETVLSSQETLDLFSEIMDVAEGEGDKEDITVKTSLKKTFLPGNNPDFMY